MEGNQPGDPRPRWEQGVKSAGPGAPDYSIRPARFEPTAVLAALLAALTFFAPVVIPGVLALVLARVAGRRIRRAGGALRGRGLVTGTKVIGTIGVLFNLAVIALTLTSGFVVSWNVGDSDPTTVTFAPGAATPTTLAPGAATATTLAPVAPGATTPAGGSTSAQSLQVGDCVRDAVTDRVVTVEVVDCGTPHAAEVFANVDVPGSAFPGEPALDATVETRCIPEFQNFVGVPYDSSVLYLEYLTPSEGTWAQGDRVITCMIVTEDHSPLTGSMRGAGR